MLATDIKSAIKEAAYHNTPTRIFVPGEKVRYGYHDNAEIIKQFSNGMFYQVRVWGEICTHGVLKPYENTSYILWDDLYKMDSFQSNSNFTKVAIERIEYRHTDMRSLIYRSYDGVDYNPPYQRELVWTKKDKILLIDSIFKGIDIGKFVFIKKDYGDKNFDWEKGIFFEILDGKQRINTIQEFYEDRLFYRGCYYSQLSFKDRNHFDSFGINQAEIPDPKDINKIYEYFIVLNTFGKTVSRKHIDKLKKLIEKAGSKG